MRLLLDTNALIRWADGTLGERAVRSVQEASVVAVSAISAAEIAVKRQLGKLRFAGTVREMAESYGFIELPLTLRHADRLHLVPAHHPDPFDRLLIAQALEEGLTILTTDRVFEAYRVPVEWA